MYHTLNGIKRTGLRADNQKCAITAAMLVKFLAGLSRPYTVPDQLVPYGP